MKQLNPKPSIFALSASVALGLLVCVAMVRLEAAARPNNAAARANAVSVDADNIGGVVASAKGPEAGVWVIAETADLGTKFRKIVVTNDKGQYLLPDLPKANYKVWVRGYGLVDSPPVNAAPGTSLGFESGDRAHSAGSGPVLSRELLGLAADDSAQERLPDARSAAAPDTWHEDGSGKGNTRERAGAFRNGH